MQDENIIQQLIQVFFALTEAELKEIYGEEKGLNISCKFQKIFNELLSKNAEMTPDQLSKQHALNPIFVMALYDAQTISKDDLSEQVLSIYRNMLKPILNQQKVSLSSSNNPWKDFVETAKVGNRNLYENEYFKLNVIYESENQFGFDINRCLYFEIFRANNHEELAPVLCKYDFILAENIKKWVRFERTETIAERFDKCDFRFLNKKTNPN
ncbi:MAG: L-2-amino-thiazoline-4-carboxylic acid hydrolase [Candidatus Sifarchaeia archaeon]|jgi:hypothetical protein